MSLKLPSTIYFTQLNVFVTAMRLLAQSLFFGFYVQDRR